MKIYTRRFRYTLMKNQIFHIRQNSNRHIFNNYEMDTRLIKKNTTKTHQQKNKSGHVQKKLHSKNDMKILSF